MEHLLLNHDAAIAALTAAFGNRVVTSQALHEQHGNTLTWVPNQPPDAVVFLQNTQDVLQIVGNAIRQEIELWNWNGDANQQRKKCLLPFNFCL